MCSVAWYYLFTSEVLFISGDSGRKDRYWTSTTFTPSVHSEY